MKKLILNKINFEGITELTREQLKRVMGGGGGDTCSATDGVGVTCGEASQPCSYVTNQNCVKAA